MELLEGQTLSERLAMGALPLEQALPYAIQIASALDAAHRRGIVPTRGGTWSSRTPEKVVDGPYATGAPASGRNYDVSPDGKRFLMIREAPGEQPVVPHIQLVQHWVEELDRLVPVSQ